MKIWYQTAAAAGDPRWKEYNEFLAGHLQAVARPGTRVTYRGTEVMSPLVEKFHYVEYLNTYQIIENAVQAQREGYDAFCLGCMGDPGFRELREVVDIPVLFIAETSIYLACLLAPKFGILAHNKLRLREMTAQVERYGLLDRLAPSGAFDVSLEQLAEAMTNPEAVIGPSKKVAKAEADAGACIMVTTCGIMNGVLAKYKITEIGGVPIIESAGAMLKMAEVLVDLKKMGMGRSKLGAFAQIAPKDLKEVRKLYGVE